MMRKSSRIPLKVLVLLLVVWGILTFRLGAPWYGVQDSFRVWIASAVRNYEIYGVDEIGLMVTRDSAPVEDPDDLYIYSHHPPLLAWMPALLTQFVGYHELGIRFGFAAVTLIGCVALYVLTRRLTNERVAWWALIFYSLVPMTSYMGRIPGHDPLGMTAGLLFGAVIINWLRVPNRARLLVLLMCAWLAVWSAWPGVFIVAGMGLAAFMLGNNRQRLAVVGMGFVTIIAFVVLMISYQLQWDGAIDSIMDAFIWRTSDAAGFSDAPSFSWAEFISKMFIDLLFFASPALLVFSVIGIFPLRKHGSRQAIIFVAMLFLAGLGYQLVFRNASYIHDYYKFFMIPAMAILCALAIVHIRFGRKTHRFARPAIDAVLLVSVVSGIAVLGILHYSGQQPRIDAIIETIDTQASPEDDVIVRFNYPGYELSTGYNRVVKFYLFRELDWGLTPNAVITSAEQASSRTLYIFCQNPDHEMSADEQRAQDDLALLADFPQQFIYEDECTLYRIDPAQLSDS